MRTAVMLAPAGGRGAVDERPTDADADTLVTFIEHAGEHYGQLVVYARLLGIVPPASRAA
jgi:hypothetical protein